MGIPTIILLAYLTTSRISDNYAQHIENNPITARQEALPSVPTPLPALPSAIVANMEREGAAAPKTGLFQFDVPFLSQAPTGNWGDLRQEDGCEEAASLMAVHWARSEAIGSAAELEEQIIAISDYELAVYGTWRDTSATDTLEHIIRGYFQYDNAEVIPFKNAEDLLKELESGHLIILPVNGKLLGNPNFQRGGPLHHMIVIKGYDYDTREFITHDPGTRKGENYRYSSETIDLAAGDYPTGDHLEATTRPKLLIRLWR